MQLFSNQTQEVKREGKMQIRKLLNIRSYSQKIKINNSSSAVNEAPLKPVSGSNTFILPMQKIDACSTSLKTNLDIKGLSLRDRIIHILALRPYKKPELLLRLKKEGILEKDKNNLTAVLAQVSVLKKNVHHLTESLWKEVQGNWKLYSKEDAKIIQEKIENHCQSKKRPAFHDNELDKKNLGDGEISNIYLPSKKQRISHFNGLDPVALMKVPFQQLKDLKCDGINKSQIPASLESFQSSKKKKSKKKKRKKNKKTFIDWDNPDKSFNLDCITNATNTVSVQKNSQLIKVSKSLHHSESSSSISPPMEFRISGSAESFTLDPKFSTMNSASFSENSNSVSSPVMSPIPKPIKTNSVFPLLKSPIPEYNETASISPPLKSPISRCHTINSVAPCGEYPISEHKIVNHVSPLLKSSPIQGQMKISSVSPLKEFPIQEHKMNFKNSSVISAVSEKSELSFFPPFVEFSTPINKSEGENINFPIKPLPKFKNSCLVSPHTKSPDPKCTELVNQNNLNVTNFSSENNISFSAQVTSNTKSSGSEEKINASNQDLIDFKSFERKIIYRPQSTTVLLKHIDYAQVLFNVQTYIDDFLRFKTQGIQHSEQSFINKESTMICDKPENHVQNTNFENFHMPCNTSKFVGQNPNVVPVQSNKQDKILHANSKNSPMIHDAAELKKQDSNQFCREKDVIFCDKPDNPGFPMEVSDPVPAQESAVPNDSQNDKIQDADSKTFLIFHNNAELKMQDSNQLCQENDLNILWDKPNDPKSLMKVSSSVSAQESAMLSNIQDDNSKNSLLIHNNVELKIQNSNKICRENSVNILCDKQDVREPFMEISDPVPAPKSTIPNNKQDGQIQDTNFKNPLITHNTVELRMHDANQFFGKNNILCVKPEKPESFMEISNPVPAQESTMLSVIQDNKVHAANSLIIHNNAELKMQDSNQFCRDKDLNSLYDKPGDVESFMEISNPVLGQESTILNDKQGDEMPVANFENSVHNNAELRKQESNQFCTENNLNVLCNKSVSVIQDNKVHAANSLIIHNNAELKMQDSNQFCRDKDLNSLYDKPGDVESFMEISNPVLGQESTILNDKQGDEMPVANFENSVHNNAELRKQESNQFCTENNLNVLCNKSVSVIQDNKVHAANSLIIHNNAELKMQDSNQFCRDKDLNSLYDKPGDVESFMEISNPVLGQESTILNDKQGDEMPVANFENSVHNNAELRKQESNQFCTENNLNVLCNKSGVIESLAKISDIVSRQKYTMLSDIQNNEMRDDNSKNSLLIRNNAELRIQDSNQFRTDKGLSIMCNKQNREILYTNSMQSHMDWKITKCNTLPNFPTFAADPVSDHEFKKYYVKITSIDQRNIYKAYFKSEYLIYCYLWESLKPAYDRLRALEDNLEESQKGTKEHERIRNSLCNTYTEYLQDPNFINVIRKRNLLHEKLDYIRKLIIEYDEKEQLNQFNTQ
ncbi:RNA polymerase II elongation factor ELL2 [Trichonephila clavipes]|nr:RNA polymerase II elongation factor ELL2 [Trichonephila clavipes]